MGFVGDEHGAAPTLDRVRLSRADADAALDDILRTVEILLRCGWVHGDLSPYNVMWWEGRATVIDLPQVSDVLRNPHGPWLFLRDVERICVALRHPGHARDVADDLWDRVFGGDEGVPDGDVAHAPPRAS